MLHVVFKDGEAAPSVEVKSTFSLRDRAENLNSKGQIAPLSATERALYLEATELMPTDGIVKETADKITAGKTSDAEKARAIYQWVVDNTFRNAATRGCGTGDVASMLRTGNLSGKCADLNALNVALIRAAGMPARDVYGIRVAPSKFGYKSLGAGSPIITKAQHCRAEVWLEGHGWVADRSRRCAQGRAGGAAGQQCARHAEGDRRARKAVRRLGRQLARLQRRPRCDAAGLDPQGRRS